LTPVRRIASRKGWPRRNPLDSMSTGRVAIATTVEKA